MRIAGVVDTHAAIWFLASDGRLSAAARAFIDSAANSGEQIALSSISLVEMAYLVEKQKIPAASLIRLEAALHTTPSTFVEIPVDRAIARALSRVNVAHIPDMPDRIIAATALHLGVPIVSRDARITASAIRTIW